MYIQKTLMTPPLVLLSFYLMPRVLNLMYVCIQTHAHREVLHQLCHSVLIAAHILNFAVGSLISGHVTVCRRLSMTEVGFQCLPPCPGPACCTLALAYYLTNKGVWGCGPVLISSQLKCETQSLGFINSPKVCNCNPQRLPMNAAADH